jgi:hypothetical protein
MFYGELGGGVRRIVEPHAKVALLAAMSHAITASRSDFRSMNVDET